MEALLTQVIAQYGALGVLIWLVYHVFRNLLPEALTRISNQIEVQRNEFVRVLSEHAQLLREQGELLRQLTTVIQRIERRLDADGE